MNYDVFIERSKMYIVREALRHVQSHGLGGSTHFYITFKTGFRGVKIPDFLKARYPDVITIVLQHSFTNLNVSDTGFGVGLAFNGQPFYIVVPFNSLVEFKDPSVNFVLGFIPEDNFETDSVEQSLPLEGGSSIPQASSNIIDLEKFRKK
ncbi:MAG: ClpXP protease specificity-enhancing factor SspB [Alphaproteobacteria bacterium]|nr:ClpXP protease specificity-enhancing factor SspB [Alphaproteobacteria bacterium]